MMNITTVQSFKMSSEIFHFLWFYDILCQSSDILSPLIYINQNTESNSATKDISKIK